MLLISRRTEGEEGFHAHQAIPMHVSCTKTVVGGIKFPFKKQGHKSSENITDLPTVRACEQWCWDWNPGGPGLEVHY